MALIDLFTTSETPAARAAEAAQTRGWNVWSVLKDGTSILAALGAAVFAGGALAMWSHDRMVGLPGAWTSYNAYLRVGAVMVPDSAISALRMINVSVGGSLNTAPLPALALAAVAALAITSFVSTQVKRVRADLLVYLLFVGYMAVVSIGAAQADRLLNIMHPANTSLIFSLPVIPAGAAPLVDQVRAALVNNDIDAATSLYGESVLVAAGLTAALLVFAWVRRTLISEIDLTRLALQGIKAARLRDVVRYLTQFAMVVATSIVLFDLAALPAAYGVLWLGKPPRCVELGLPASPGVHPNGFLLTNLATDPGEIQLARWDDDARAVVLDIYPRNTVRTVTPDSACGRFYPIPR